MKTAAVRLAARYLHAIADGEPLRWVGIPFRDHALAFAWAMDALAGASLRVVPSVVLRQTGCLPTPSPVPVERLSPAHLVADAQEWEMPCVCMELPGRNGATVTAAVLDDPERGITLAVADAPPTRAPAAPDDLVGHMLRLLTGETEPTADERVWRPEPGIVVRTPTSETWLPFLVDLEDMQSVVATSERLGGVFDRAFLLGARHGRVESGVLCTPPLPLGGNNLPIVDDKVYMVDIEVHVPDYVPWPSKIDLSPSPPVTRDVLVRAMERIAALDDDRHLGGRIGRDGALLDAVDLYVLPPSDGDGLYQRDGIRLLVRGGRPCMARIGSQLWLADEADVTGPLAVAGDDVREVVVGDMRLEPVVRTLWPRTSLITTKRIRLTAPPADAVAG